MNRSSLSISLVFLLGLAGRAFPQENAFRIPLDTWVKLTPLEATPVSPRLGYEGACVWDSKHDVLIRYGGHNQGGGGEQNAEIWTFDPVTARWEHKLPNTSPPGVCCAQQNVFDPVRGRYVRFPAFSGSHGWQWWREIWLNDSSVWTYDLETNVWRNLRPLPAPHVRPLRCASWDSDLEVIVVFGGEGSHDGTVVYDPWLNTWKSMRPPEEPAARSAGSMAYDAARKIHILFGAQFQDDPHTWAYDLRANEWRDLEPKASPPTDRNDAVLAYDPKRSKVLAIVKITTGEDEDARHRLETWAYDAAENTWTRLEPEARPDPSGNRARNLVFAPELDAFLLENCTHPPQAKREQQVWAYRLKSAGAGERSTEPAGETARRGLRSREAPLFVEDAVVSVLSKNEVEIAWAPPPGDGVAGYHVERAVVEVWSDDELRRLKTHTPPLELPSVGAIRKIGAPVRLTKEPRKETSFTDKSVDFEKREEVEGDPLFERRFPDEDLDPEGKPYPFAVYAYRVITVNGAGVESGPSPAFFTIPSAPPRFFSKEDGTTCHLEWHENPEKKLRGYRVYRMDGRYDNEPIPRLTSEPIAATKYSDEEAGTKTRRYYVVAVDALGQEGFPSSPVWFDREWKAFYEPFTDEWHQ